MACFSIGYVVVFRQILGRHRQIRVQDHQHVATRARESKTNRIALAPAELLEGLDVEVRIRSLHPLDLLPGAVIAATLDEDDLHIWSKFRDASCGCLDVSELVPARNDDADR
jgi:hypothetical protein